MFEDGNESRVFGRTRLCRAARIRCCDGRLDGVSPYQRSEVVESISERSRRFHCSEFVENLQRCRIGIEGRLRAETGKFRTENELPKGGFSFRGELVRPHGVFTRNTRLLPSSVATNRRGLLFTLVEISYSPRG